MALGLLAMASGAPGVRAQEPDGLQAAAAARITALQQRLDRLQRQLMDSAPEQGGRARRARALLTELRLADRMATARGLLSTGRWDEAATAGKQIRSDLLRVMDALLAEGSEVPDELARMQRMADMRDRVESLRERQQQLTEKTGKPDADAAEVAAEQQALADEAAAVADELSAEHVDASGAEEVAKAVPEMAGATESLQQGDKQKAQGQQQQAEAQLAAAQEKLEEALEGQREQLKEELRAQLVAAVEEMLKEQQRVRGATERLARELGAGAGDTSAALGRLATAQQALGVRADGIGQQLTAEGSTMILAELFREISGLCVRAAEGLARGGAGVAIQGLQLDVEGLLASLAASLDESESGEDPGEQEGESNQGGQPQEEDEPLVPVSAELKLVLQLQSRVNQQTVQLAVKADPADPNHRQRVAGLARSQARIRGLTRQIAEKLVEQQREKDAAQESTEEPPSAGGNDR